MTNAAAPPKPRWRRQVLAQVGRALVREETSIAAASIAFYGFLALLPSLLVVIVLYGSWADPRDVQRQLAFVGRLLPPETVALLGEEMAAMAARSEESRGAGAAFSLLLALWSASKGIRAALFAVRGPAPRSELSGRIRRALVALGLAGGAVLLVVIAVAAMMAFPELLGKLGIPHKAAKLIRVLRWPVLAIIVFAWLAVLYRYGPGRAEAGWRRVVWGAVAATALWLAGSAGFSFYVARFGNSDPIEGSLAGALVLLGWLLLAAYAVLLGGQLNRALQSRPRAAGQEG
jgi:membrane protein